MKKVKSWRYIILILILILIIGLVVSALFPNLNKVNENQILIIPIIGEISNSNSNSFLSSNTVSSESIIQSIEKAKETDNIKAVIFDINSPGGTVLASKEIADAVKKLNKPNVALIRDVGASGAYWIASSSNKIVADPLSITGSIGVISSYLQFSDLLNKYGITYERLVSGVYKDAGTPYKELTPEERNIIQSKLDKIDQVFLNQVKINRNLKDIARIKTGEFFLGSEAKDLGLIDYLGNKDTAVEVAKNLSNIKEAKLVEFKEKKSILDALTKLNANAFYYLGQGIGSQLYFDNKNQNLQINAL